MRLANLWSVAAGRERLCLVANRSRRIRESLATGEQLRAAAHGMVPFNIFLRSPAFGIINIYIYPGSIAFLWYSFINVCYMLYFMLCVRLYYDVKLFISSI